MGVWDFLKSVVIDEYKYGVERQSVKPIVYFNIDKVDLSQHRLQYEEFIASSKEVFKTLKKNFKEVNLYDEDQIKSLPPDLQRKFVSGMEFVASLVRPQIEEFHPGITENISNLELTNIFMAATSDGPFADRHTLKDHGLCLINEPKGDELNPDTLIKKGFFNFGGDPEGFNPDHIRPLPGEKELWDQLIGEHEGEHCNQESQDDLPKEEMDIQALDQEIRSDRAALKSMREAGHHDIAQAWVDIRIISTVMGDSTHATSLFIESNTEYTGVTQKHRNAAADLREEMNNAVSKGLGINLLDAETLRKEDPQKYADTLEARIKTGDFPTEHKIDTIKMEEKIANAAGFPTEGLTYIPVEDIPWVIETYKKLDAAGELDKRVESPDIVKKMAEQYIGATRRIFIEDTTPKSGSILASPPPDHPEKPLDERLEDSAEIETYAAIDKNVARKLGITVEDAQNLFHENITKYLDTAESMIREGTFSQETNVLLTQKEMDNKVASLLGTTPDKLETIPPNLRENTQAYLNNKGEGVFLAKNPYLIERVKTEIQNMRTDRQNEPNLAKGKTGCFSDNASDCTSAISGNSPPISQKDMNSSPFQKNSGEMTNAENVAGLKAPTAQILQKPQQVIAAI